MSDLRGDRISHYRIVSLLGKGGMGAVYRAHDERLGRDLALKVLLADSTTDANARARLVREARLASSLNHPHIAHVYEVDEDGEQVFIAMELVEGRTLREAIPPTGMPAEPLLRHALQIADALGYAHEHGVIHRDLKSANIMLTTEGRVKVLDFGLAKRVGDITADDTQDLNLTASGIVLGTPTHLPPEVLKGAAADARSDVWALGVVLYEMASGRFPFDGTSIGQLADAIVNGTPTPLSGRVPVGIQAIIGRCLAKDPAQRYRNGSEVRAAIEAASGAKTPGAGTRARWMVPAGMALVAMLALALALGPGHLLDRLAGRAHGAPIRSLAVLPLANLSGDPAQEYFADGMTEELITNLAPLQSLKVISRTSVMRFKGSQLPLKEIAKALAVDAIVEGSVQRAGDRVRITAQLIEASSDRHLWARSFERDFRDVLAIQSEVARDIASQIQLQLSPQASAKLASRRPINPEAYEYYLRGRFEWNKVSDQGLRASLGYFSKALAIDPGDARYSSGMADAYVSLVQITESLPPEEGMAKVKQYAQQALAADEQSAEAHTSMAAALFFADWKLADAEREVRRALELNPGYSTAHLVYSVILSAGGRVEEAIAQDKLGLELDPYSLIINWNAGTTLYLDRQYDASLAQMVRTQDLFPGAMLAWGSVLRIYEQKGDYRGALDVLEKNLPEEDGGKALVARIRRAYDTEGPDGYWRAVMANVMGKEGSTRVTPERAAMIYTRLGDHPRALDQLERAYAEHSGEMLFLKVNPCYEPLHGEPRFQALLQRLGFTS